eukprot:PhM_4_TR7500/c0_g1_i2/m.48560
MHLGLQSSRFFELVEREKHQRVSIDIDEDRARWKLHRAHLKRKSELLYSRDASDLTSGSGSEVESVSPLIPEAPQLHNAALGRHVVHRHGAGVAQCVVDGHKDTFWISSPARNQWIYVDLEFVTKCTTLRLLFNDQLFATAFRVEVSCDAREWVCVRDRRGLRSPSSLGNRFWAEINLSNARGRYVRFWPTATSTEDDILKLHCLEVLAPIVATNVSTMPPKLREFIDPYGAPADDEENTSTIAAATFDIETMTALSATTQRRLRTPQERAEKKTKSFSKYPAHENVCSLLRELSESSTVTEAHVSRLEALVDVLRANVRQTKINDMSRSSSQPKITPAHTSKLQRGNKTDTVVRGNPKPKVAHPPRAPRNFAVGFEVSEDGNSSTSSRRSELSVRTSDSFPLGNGQRGNDLAPVPTQRAFLSLDVEDAIKISDSRSRLLRPVPTSRPLPVFDEY